MKWLLTTKSLQPRERLKLFPKIKEEKDNSSSREQPILRISFEDLLEKNNFKNSQKKMLCFFKKYQKNLVVE